jgi:DNA-binding transcriptional ArsR family regulator
VIDQLREQIQKRLDEVTAEAERLRTALGALEDRASTTTERRRPARRRSRSAAPTRPTRAAKPARARRTASAPARTSRRTASGSTKAAVLSALAGGEAMTATEVAAKAGLGRATVSTTLSKLSKSGEVQKADRGYQLSSSNGASAGTD